MIYNANKHTFRDRTWLSNVFLVLRFLLIHHCQTLSPSRAGVPSLSKKFNHSMMSCPLQQHKPSTSEVGVKKQQHLQKPRMVRGDLLTDYQWRHPKQGQKPPLQGNFTDGWEGRSSRRKSTAAVLRLHIQLLQMHPIKPK